MAFISGFAGCDRVAATDYRGEPLLSLEAQITQLDVPNSPITGDYRVALFWSRDGSTDLTTAELVEQRSVSVSVTFPGIVKLNVFEPPDRSSFQTGQPYALGMLLAYHDRNSDGRYTPGATPGELIGGVSDRVILYSPTDLTAQVSPLSVEVDAGFHLISLPFPCANGFPRTLGTGEDCGIELGSPCESDADCGPGTCVTSAVGLTFKGGYCALMDPSYPLDCTPPLATPIEIAGESDYLSMVGRHCVVTGDCRVADGYDCDALFQVCLPASPLQVRLIPGFCVAPVCLTCVPMSLYNEFDAGLPYECIEQEAVRQGIPFDQCFDEAEVSAP